MVLSQRIHGAFKGAVERMTGPRTVSTFKEKRVLGVSEFVLAGDNLVSKCPTWSRESGDPSKRKPYLPSDKQFFITKNVPCLRRTASIADDYEAVGGEVLVEDEDNDGWLATHGRPKDKGNEDENLPSMDALEINERDTIQSIPKYAGGEEENIPEMAEFEEIDNAIDNDPATLQSNFLVAHEPDDDNIFRTTTYDVSITYDKYYQTPCVWLTGYDEVIMPFISQNLPYPSSDVTAGRADNNQRQASPKQNLRCRRPEPLSSPVKTSEERVRDCWRKKARNGNT